LTQHQEEKTRKGSKFRHYLPTCIHHETRTTDYDGSFGYPQTFGGTTPQSTEREGTTAFEKFDIFVFLAEWWKKQ